VAAINTKRSYIGIELDEKYFNIACDRIEEAIREKEQLLF
jgi:DNA modification methylase